MKFDYDDFCQWAFGYSPRYGISELIKCWSASELLQMWNDLHGKELYIDRKHSRSEYLAMMKDHYLDSHKNAPDDAVRGKDVFEDRGDATSQAPTKIRAPRGGGAGIRRSSARKKAGAPPDA